jgi:hypothetical protein
VEFRHAAMQGLGSEHFFNAVIGMPFGVIVKQHRHRPRDAKGGGQQTGWAKTPVDQHHIGVLKGRVIPD